VRLRFDGSAILPGHSAGVETFAYGLLGGLAELDRFDLTVDVARSTTEAWRAEVDAPGIRWNEVSVPLTVGSPAGRALRKVLPAGIGSSRLARKAISAVRGRAARPAEDDADVTLYPFHRVPVRTPRSVVTVHDLRAFQPEFANAADVDVVRRNVAAAGAVVASWPHPYRQLTESFPTAAGKAALIPLPAFTPGRPVDAPRDPALLLYPSSTAEHKNHVNLVRAMSVLPGLRLVCPGPLVEPQAGRAAAEVAGRGLGDRVSFPGFVSRGELEQLFARASVVVVPSMWEAASGAVFEAFSWGLPVACADVPPLRAQIDFAGGNAAFFDPADPADMARAVRTVVADRERYAEASRRAGLRLAGRSWREVAADYAAVLDWVGRGRRGPMPVAPFVAGASW
jgi:glycosyltransferase involved in cell wall biosynthesis